MLHTARRLLTGPLLVAALGAGVAVAPEAAMAAGVSATVKVSTSLKVRSAPSLAARAVGSLRNGAKVTVSCVVTGQNVRGTVRTTTAWDRLSTGGYISHAYVKTTRTLSRCATGTPTAVRTKAKPVTAAKKYVVGTVRSLEGRVNLRSGPSTSSSILGSVASGTEIDLVCAVAGQNVDGSVRTTTQWDRTSTGRYISHGYIYSGPLKACTGSSVPAPSVSLTPEQFIKNSVPGAQRGWREYGVPASVTIAQAILESGWGRSGLASVDKNYFGIKCQNGSYGKLANGCHTYRTQECTKAGNCFSTSAVFRTYATQSHSFRDHGSFLRVNPRYKPAFAYTKNANKFIWKVWKAGYATDPNYYTKVTGIMASWNLYQYDTFK
ncbi:sporangiospore maturation cell wall hydrolase GsmA [Couchioplanes caeruleus]|uniref:Flagellar protein FlgJ n=2 Tax=Couchioplanes caeruleus TaxID=56438 RepID=A0A3N1GV95_9ACTN|nr:sporangiospore maturation cell wall hydrolase GsmA [Couchioplanes caeruleus]ROP34201.1 flagellar protein FlgJ [Couchioplanes caeruleus]